MVRRTILLASFGAVLACPYRRKEESVAVLSGGPIEATIRYTKVDEITLGAIGQGHVGLLVPMIGHQEQCILSITKPKTLMFRLGPECHPGGPFALAADPSGTRIAYSGKARNGDWSIIAFGRDNRSFDLPRPAATPLDWATAPTLDNSLEELYRTSRNKDLVADEVRSTHDETRISLFLEKTSDVDSDGTTLACDAKGPTDPWSRLASELSANAKARVYSKLREALLAPTKENAHATSRAIQLLDIESKDLLPALVKVLSSDFVSHQAYGIALRVMAKFDSKKAAEQACDFFKRKRNESYLSVDTGHDFRAAAGVLASRRAACPEVYALLANVETYCSSDAWFCSPRNDTRTTQRRRCTADEVKPKLVLFEKASLAEIRTETCDRANGWEWTAAYIATRPDVPKAVSRAIDRSGYALARISAPACRSLPESSAGTDCSIHSSEVQWPTNECDGRSKSVPLYERVNFTLVKTANGIFDDGRREIRVVRSDEPIPTATTTSSDASSPRDANSD